MKIIYTPVWQNPGSKRSARDFVREEIELMELVEGLGFDATFSPEHHFDIDYSACPDNFLPLSYIAARTTTLQVGLGAVILPWNDPLRAAEKLSFLDHLSDGRCLVGLGRGLAKIEYDHFGIEMSSSRGRFDEAAEMVINALRTGYIEGDGPYYPQKRTPIHPKPRPALADELYSVGMSPDSAVVAGELGARLLTFVTKPVPDMLPLIEGYCAKYADTHSDGRSHVVLDDFFLVRESADEALELGMLYASNYFKTVVRHYEMDGTHFENAKGYTAYAEDAKALREAGIDAAAEAYVNAQVGIGTPAQIVERIEERFKLLGPEISQAGCFFYGGMSKQAAAHSLELFGQQAIPAIRELARTYVTEES
ncbi:LLM class flavin-dependent oxidoreductase [Saccharomonospora sp. NPDC046836]|uniref:LLM class flavin-dependent oxidoreductase n=1 Tax=Saccharomonospora sp. NPDC046836 TaxID=3156921 RepID=UPI0033EE541E